MESINPLTAISNIIAKMPIEEKAGVAAMLKQVYQADPKIVSEDNAKMAEINARTLNAKLSIADAKARLAEAEAEAYVLEIEEKIRMVKLRKDACAVVKNLETDPVVEELETAPVVEELKIDPVVNELKTAPVVDKLKTAPVAEWSQKKQPNRTGKTFVISPTTVIPSNFASALLAKGKVTIRFEGWIDFWEFKKSILKSLFDRYENPIGSMENKHPTILYKNEFDETCEFVVSLEEDDRYGKCSLENAEEFVRRLRQILEKPTKQYEWHLENRTTLSDSSAAVTEYATGRETQAECEARQARTSCWILQNEGECSVDGCPYKHEVKKPAKPTKSSKAPTAGKRNKHKYLF